MKRIAYPKMVNESTVRGVAFWVVLLSISGIYSRGLWVPLFLGVDFLIRAFIHPRFSPLVWLSQRTSSRLFMGKDRQIFSTPKRFAARIGLLLALTATLLVLFQQPFISAAVIVLLGIFSFLECFFGFCAGCKIFGLLARYDLVNTSDCPNCEY